MYGQENAYILPNQQRNPLDTWNDLQRQQQEQQRYQEQLRQQQEHYNNSLLSGLANRLDFKDFATGTVFDPVFQHNLDLGLKGIAETLKGGGSYADALTMAMRTAGEVGNYSNLIKKKRAEIEAGASQYAKDLSIDADALKKHALTRYLFNPDHTMKDTSKLADDSDYVTSLLENNPELVTKGLGSLYDQVEKGKYVPYKADVQRNIGGIDRDLTYEGKYDPLYNDLVDAKGNVVDANSGNAVGVRVKGKKFKVGEAELDGVDDETLNHFYQSVGTKAAVRAEAKRLLPLFPQGTKQSDVERFVLHRELSGSANSYINKTKDKVSDAQLQRERAALERQQRGFEHAETMAAIRANKEGKGELTINDVYGAIKKETDAMTPGYKGVAVSVLPTEAQKIVLDEARKLTGINQLGNRHIYLKKDPQTGSIGLYWADEIPLADGGKTSKDQHIGTLTPTGINLKAQPDAKRKGAVIEKGNVKKADLRKKYNY